MIRIRWNYQWLAAFFVVAVFGHSQTDADPGQFLIDSWAKSHLSKPELGWIMPNGELISELNSPKVTILTENTAPRVALQTGTIPANSALNYVKHNHVDCDQVDDPKHAPVYRYAAKMPVSKFETQVFVLAGDHASAIQAGLEEYKATDAELTPLWRAMHLGAGEKHLARSVRQANAPFFYTVAATYRHDGMLLRQGLFLEDHSGRIIGDQIDEINGQNQCDGCEALTFKDGLKYVHSIQNMYSFPGLPYPVILEDSSTVELRAIDLITFDSSGKESQYRKYEYMVNCLTSAN